VSVRARRLVALNLAALNLAALNVVALLAVSACATPAVEVTLRDDNFRPYREFTAGRVVVSSLPNFSALELVARVDRQTAAIDTLVSVEVVYQDYHARHYESARDARATPLVLERVSHDGGCQHPPCAYGERFTVAVPITELRNAPAGGYQLKVFAKDGGDMLVAVPRGDIDRLLAVVDKH